MFIDTKAGSRAALQWYPFIGERGSGGLQRNIWKSSRPTSTIFIQAGTANRVAFENVFASFVRMCVRVRGGEGVKGWLPQLDFNFRASSLVRNGQNETIRMKFSAPKQLMNWNEISNRRRLRSFIQRVNIRQNSTSTLYFPRMWKFITPSNGQIQSEELSDLLGRIFANKKHELTFQRLRSAHIIYTYIYKISPRSKHTPSRIYSLIS